MAVGEKLSGTDRSPANLRLISSSSSDEGVKICLEEGGRGRGEEGGREGGRERGGGGREGEREEGRGEDGREC